jgi:hypothetical protein
MEMAQFGAGPELAAQCPTAPPLSGWRPWSDADGPIPNDLTSRAQALTDDAATPLGTVANYPLPGVTALIRVEPRVWARDAQGGFTQGCFRTTGVYLPTSAVPVASEDVTPPTSTDKLSKWVGIFTIASLAVGTAATLAAWSRR